jgi:mono/diheme cytochrome c family protein
MQVKLAVSILFIAVGTVAVLSMLYVMGRPEKKISPGAMRNTHRIMGLIFTVLLLVLAWIGAGFVGAMGDGMSLRAVFHAVFALSLIAVLLMKILIVKFYRELMRFVPTMGLVVFALAFVVFFTSAGFHFARDLRPEPSGVSGDGGPPVAGRDAGASGGVEEGEDQGPGEDSDAGSDRYGAATTGGQIAADTGPAAQRKSMPEGDVKVGRAIFNNKCVGCHDADSRKSLFGPGLLGLMKWEALRSTGEPPTPGSVRNQIIDPVGTMPAFTTFSKEEMDNLLAYLGTL